MGCAFGSISVAVGSIAVAFGKGADALTQRSRKHRKEWLTRSCGERGEGRAGYAGTEGEILGGPRWGIRKRLCRRHCCGRGRHAPRFLSGEMATADRGVFFGKTALSGSIAKTDAKKRDGRKRLCKKDSGALRGEC
jgi:hypothetical protein